MKILITGGAGFIGQALSLKLRGLGHDVLVIDNLSPQIHGELPQLTLPEGVTFVRLDAGQLGDRLDLVDGCDAVYHLAAETGTAQSMYEVRKYVGVNDGGTAALLEAIGKCSHRPRRLILASSRSVYGEGAYVSAAAPTAVIQPAPRTREQLLAGQWEIIADDGEPLKPVPTPETLPFAPGSVYAATKAAQELLVSSAAAALGYTPVIFRFQNVFGAGQSLRNPYTGIISIFFNRARQGLEIPIYEDGLESRDFVYIDDIVEGLVRGLDADVPPGAVMNLGAGVPTSISRLARVLLSAAGLDVPVRVTGQFRVGDIRHCYADLARARAILGFEPRVSLEEGLRRFCAWAATQPVHVDQLDKATEELRRKGLAK